VVGAGGSGGAGAQERARRGARVRVFDGRDVAQGATQASAGVLAPYTEGHAGTPLLDLGARSLALYDDFVRRARDESGLDVPYARTGTLEVATDEAAAARLRERAAGGGAFGRGTLLDASSLRDAEPQLAADVALGLLTTEHGFVAAGALTHALAESARRNGAVFDCARTVTAIDRTDGGLAVRAGGEMFSADSVVLAAGSWSGRIGDADPGRVPVRPVRGQLLHLEWPAGPPARVVWGPRCYLVPWPDGSVLVGATVEEAGFDERATVTGVHDLLEAACDLVPQAWRAAFRGVRVGLRPGTPDEVPIIGPSNRVPGLFYATGHYRNGVLLAPVTARLVADFVLDNRADPALETTRPSRFGDL
jgi:glycine oxidase